MALRLLVIAEGYPHGANLAGVFHRDQLQLLAAAGFDVCVVGPTPWVPPGFAGTNVRWRNYASVPRRQTDGKVVIRRPRYLAMPRENHFGLPDLFQYLTLRSLRLPKPDVILAFFALPMGAVARRLARHWNVPYLVGMLGDDVNVYPHQNKRYRRLLDNVLRDAAVAFANGPSLAAEAQRLTGVAVQTLSIGVSAERFAGLPTKIDARNALGLPRDRFIILYVGSHIGTKGIPELAEAVAGLSNDRRLLCVTVGDGPLRHEMEALPNVRCMGVRSAEQVALLMAAGDLLVHPSHYEGLPTVLVEAGLAGTPVLTTDAPGCIDLAAQGRALVVPAKNAAALRSALANVMDSPEMLQPLAVAMREHVRREYLLERNTTTLADLIRRSAMQDLPSGREPADEVWPAPPRDKVPSNGC